MKKTSINCSKAFLAGFIPFFVLPFIALFAWANIEGKSDELFSQRALAMFPEMLLTVTFFASIFGGFMALLAWCGKRSQKTKEKDEINELMREYLEKKLREENKL